jgi:lysophospholipid acyltransferase (LPLAT)-like uncharacterized protein
VSAMRVPAWLTPASKRPCTESKVFARFFQKALLSYIVTRCGATRLVAPPVDDRSAVVKKFLATPRAQAALAKLAALYIQLVARRVRWRLAGEAHLAAFAAGPPMIVVFWHETLPSMPILWLSARRRGLTRPGMALASRHRDGRLIGQVLRHMGIGLVFGSSSRGGAAGLRGLLRALEGGAHVALTPDGPRGPAHVCAPGVAQLAALSGARVLPCAAIIRPALTLSSWDTMRLPLPFGRGALVLGPPLAVAREDWRSGLAQIDAALNATMARAAALL